MSSFDTYQFGNDAAWNAIESNLYFSDNTTDRQAIITKRKHKYYKANIDPSHVIPDNKSASQSTDTAGDAQPNNTSHADTSSHAEARQPPEPQPTASSTSAAQTSMSQRISQLVNSPLAAVNIFIPHIHALLHILTLVSIILYFLPLLGLEFSNVSFFNAIKLCMLTSVIHVLRKYGRPTATTVYVQKLGYDEYTQLIMYCAVMLFIQPPVSICIIPVALRSVLFTTKYTKRLLPSYRPTLYARIEPTVNNILQREGELKNTVGTLEVFVGVLLILNLVITPNKQFFITFLYWQLLRAKWNMSATTKHAFTAFRLQIESLLTHRYVPAVVGQPLLKGWNLICNFVYSQADMTSGQQAGGAGGLASRCSIM